MTVSSSTSKVSYSGNGSLTVFAYTFKIFDQDDLTVILRASDGTETTQTITTHYTVSGVGNAGGGNVTFVTAPASGVTVVILREQPLTQELDLVPNDPFPAQSLEESLDKLVFMVQAHSEELDRAIKASKTNVINGAEFTISAADRANKIFAFDSSGDVSITQEIGVYRGNWATSTAYNQRDIVKDTSNNNIYICNTAHTSSGSTPISSNADTAKWYLLVDAASATAAQTAAEAAQTAAETAQTAAETAQTAAETAETNAETAQTAAEAAQAAAELAYDNFDDRYLGAKASDPATDNDGNALITGALYFNTTSGMKVYDGSAWDDVKPTAAEQTNIDAVAADATDIGTVATNIANVNTVAGISGNVTTVAGISADVTTVAADGTDIGTVATNISNVNTVAGISANVTTVAGISANVTTVAGISANVTTVAGDTANIGTIATNLNGTDTIGTVAAGIANINTVATDITNVNTVATNINSVNNFANSYVVSATEPASPVEGMLWFDTSTDTMKVYNGSSFQNAGSSVNGTSERNTYTATSGQTSFAATYDPGYVDVYVNGVKQVNGTDFTATSGSAVVLAAGAAAGDIVDIVAYGTFELADVYTKSAADARYAQLANNLSDLSSAATALTNLGLTATAAELNYVDGVTSNVQTQLDAKMTPTYTGDVDITGELIVDSYNETHVALSGTTPTVDCESGNVFSLSTSGNTTFTFSNPPASGTAYGFMLKLTAGGTHTITYPASVDWAGATAPDAPASGETDVLVFTTVDGGTTWYGALAIDAAG